MAISKSHPMRFTPKGLTDAYDSTDEFPGACQSLANLTFDQSNPEIVVARSGVVQLASFSTAGFASPGFISVHATIGNLIYGLIATSRNAGKDEPFIFNATSGTFVPLTGVTGAASPFSQAITGDWTPPTIANIGVMVIVTHPGFAGTANKIGWFDMAVPTAPVWHAGDTATNALAGVPTAVANFNNRAWFSYQNQVQYTDPLTNPPTRTNATQGLTIGDNTVIVALAGLPVQTTSSGVVQSLTVFKNSQVWQITGDTVTTNLALNYVSLTIGTTSPRSVAQSTTGLYFISTGGPYFLDALGTLRALTYTLDRLEPDIQVPFQTAQTPTRWAGAYASSVYRICGPTVLKGVQTTNDYWFDEHKRRWNGPHSFAYDCASVLNGNFVLSSGGNSGLLGLSTVESSSTSVFTDLASPYSCGLLSSTFPKVSDMMVKQVVESQLELEASLGLTAYTVQAQDEQGTPLGTVVMQVKTGGNNWGAFVWGDGTLWSTGITWGSGALWGSTAQFGSNQIWRSGQQIPSTYAVGWATPLVFEKMQLSITVQASQQAGIGTFYARYQQTGYMIPTSISTSAISGTTTMGPGVPVGSGTITTLDEGVTLSTQVNQLNFVGAGVTASGTGLMTTVTIPGTLPGTYYNVRNYGAAGDGSTIDTTAIKAAISAAATAGGGTVYFPAGNYRIDSGLNHALGLSYLGDGFGSTTILWKPAANVGGVILTTTNIYLPGMEVAGITFKRDPSISAAVTGILCGSTAALQNSADAVFTMCQFDSLTTGIAGNATVDVGLYDSTVSGCWFKNCGTGFDPYGSGNSLVSCKISGSSFAGVNLGYLSSLSFAAVQCFDCVHILNTTDINVPNSAVDLTRPCSWYGCWFEGSTNGIVTLATANTTLMTWDFNGCQFSTFNATHMMDFSNALGVINIKDCTTISGGVGKAQDFVPPTNAIGYLNIVNVLGYDASLVPFFPTHIWNVPGATSRIYADWSNATLASRTAFQSSTLNGATRIMTLPNGTSTTAQYVVTNAADPTNAGQVAMSATSALMSISSAANGAGSVQDLSLAISGVAMTLFKANQDVQLGKSGAATADTTGHTYIQSVAGAPTGVPTGYAGFSAMRYDTTNHKLWVYDGGWKGVVLS